MAANPAARLAPAWPDRGSRVAGKVETGCIFRFYPSREMPLQSGKDASLLKFNYMFSASWQAIPD
jgi:hypothetical protein